MKNKQSNKPICQILTQIYQKQCQIQTFRQLLNQEIQFTVSGTFRALQTLSKSRDQLDLYSFKNALSEYCEQQIDQKAVQSVLKFYSNNNLSINEQQWGAIVLSRDDGLLHKMSKSRDNNPFQVPKYLLNYCKKIIFKEYQLHKCLINLRNQSNTETWFKKLTKNDSIDPFFLQTYCFQHLSHISHLNPHQVIIRYLKKGGKQQPCLYSMNTLFNQTISRQVEHFVNDKIRQYAKKQDKQKENNPFVHQEIRKSLKKLCGSVTIGAGFRPSKSIQSHILRGKCLHSTQQIKLKIDAYGHQIRVNLQIFYKYLHKIIALTAKKEQNKAKNIENKQGNLSVLFKQISNSQEMIPSQLQNYLKTIGVQIKKEKLYILFKRFANPITGKLSLKQFQNIFTSPFFKKQKQEGQLLTQTKRACINYLLKQIAIQDKIQVLKRKLLNQADLREVFTALDQNSDGLISRTDLQVVQKSLFGHFLNDEKIQLLWWRMGLKNIKEFVGYQTFMYEIIPRMKERNRPKTNKK